MQLTDREQIQEMMARYALALDKKDYDGVAACFTADAEIVYAGYSGTLKGHDVIIAHMKHAIEPLDATQHLFTNFLIDVDGDDAQLTCYIIAQHVRKGTPGGDFYLAGGRYELKLKRDGGAWKMAWGAPQQLWGDGNRDLLPKSN